MTRIWTLAKDNFEAGKWLQVLVPLVILVFYYFSFSSFLSFLMPDEDVYVTGGYARDAGVFLLFLSAGLYLVFFLLHKVSGGGKPTFGSGGGRPSLGDLILVLIPLTPITQYILNNQAILSPLGSLYVLAVFGLFSLLFIIVLPSLLGLICSPRTMIFLGLAFTFTITNMASLSAGKSWFEKGDILLLMALFWIIFLAGMLVHHFVGRKFLYGVAALFFLANSATQLATKVPEPVPPPEEERHSIIVDLVGSRQPALNPNIYFLVYDAYVASETLIGYGIDNSTQENFLESSGFKLYPKTYSVAGATISSISRTLNVANSYYGKPRTAVSGDGIVQNLLRGFGYSTVGVFYSDYFFQGMESTYDFSYPGLKATHRLLEKAIFMGEFRFDVEIDNPPYEKFSNHKSKVFRDTPDSPRFVYMHDELPGHSQNSGQCRPNEIELFQDRLDKANAGMVEDVDLILENDPGAIIIVAGDHGPYLTKNCHDTGDHFDMAEISRLDIQDRLGTFLAIKWPDDRSTKYDDIDILQDVFPAIFAYLLDDEKLLEARIRMETLSRNAVSGASVKGGVIQGGINDGEPLFLNRD